MYTVRGGCHCGNIGLELSLSRAPAAFVPRACDCDFCRGHAAAYVSDPQGSLVIMLRDPAETARYRQGSGQAEFLLCARCGVLAAALYTADERSYAAVNVKAVQGGRDFAAEQVSSPQQLSPEEKQRRWRQLWFGQLRFETGSGRS